MVEECDVIAQRSALNRAGVEIVNRPILRCPERVPARLRHVNPERDHDVEVTLTAISRTDGQILSRSRRN